MEWLAKGREGNEVDITDIGESCDIVGEPPIPRLVARDLAECKEDWPYEDDEMGGESRALFGSYMCMLATVNNQCQSRGCQSSFNLGAQRVVDVT